MAKLTQDLPLKPPPDPPKRRDPAPSWVPLATAWIGLAALLLSFVIPFVPGSKDPIAELKHARPYAPADWVLMVAIYLVPAALALGLVVFRQMKTEPRPLPDSLVLQRFQAWVGIILALAAAAVIYIYVALHGPKAR